MLNAPTSDPQLFRYVGGDAGLNRVSIYRPRMRVMSASLIGRLGVKHFQAIRHHSVDVARKLVLLFGNGAKAFPVWDSRTKWHNLCGGLN
jgi:hypothetical protein